jgi:small multidrug resistance pump
MHWVYLLVAIAAEVVGTSALKHTDGFTKLGPSLIVFAGYAAAFYFLSLTLKILPVGIAYAIWSGVGMVLISLVGWIVFREALDAPALIGMSFIIVGVAIINLLSKSVSH